MNTQSLRALSLLALITAAIPGTAAAAPQEKPPTAATPVVAAAPAVSPVVAPALAPATAPAIARFGYDVLKIDGSALLPGPIDKSYMLSPGDKLTLKVWGQLQLTHVLEVTNDFYVEIPDVPGRVFVSGLPLSEVEDRLTRQLATAYATYFDLEDPGGGEAFVDVTLTEVRDLRFLVQGEVESPGSYTLHPSHGNIIYALARAGGVKPRGSLRGLRIRRAGTDVSVDLYDLLLKGTAAPGDLQIRNGDMIFVPLKHNEVTVQGEVRRPGIYELSDAKTEDLDGLLELAGGVLPTATIDRILIRRVQQNVGPRTVSVNLSDATRAGEPVRVQDQDTVIVLATNAVRRDFVELKGNGVLVPGEYQFSAGLRITDLIRVAGGLTPDAYLARADLQRMGPDMLRTYVRIDLEKAAAGDPAHNIALTPLDELVVYNVRDIEGSGVSVRLAGHVKQPGDVPFSRGMRVYDLLFGRAGLQDKDFVREVYLPRGDVRRVVPGGTRRELVSFDLGKLIAGDQTQNLALQGDDEVVIYSRSEMLGADRKVTLSGHVKNAGAHELLQGMRLLDLLRSKGGFEDPDFRLLAYLPRGEVLRPVRVGDHVEKELIRFDLGAVLDGGDPAQNISLQSGDEVVIYAAKDFEERQTVEISGAVNKAGTYPLAANMTLEDLLIKAGGLQELADPTSADLFRVTVRPDGQVALDTSQVPLTDLAMPLHNRDRVLIRPRRGYEPSRVVHVSGEVQYPGEYSVAGAAARVADVLRMAGGTRSDAFLEGASLTRRTGAADDSRKRIVLDFERALSDPSSTDNLLLDDGDQVHVPRRSNTVTVINAAQQSITIAHQGGKGVKHYLQAAGGVTAGTDEKTVRVLLPNGRYAAPRFLRGLEVMPGSTIIVPSGEEAKEPSGTDAEGAGAGR